jgi:hypothetical protein
MTHQDFEQLPTSIQREFVLNACENLLSIRIDQEITIDLFYSCNGDFFVELYVSRKKKSLISIKSFYFNDHHLHKFLIDINISTAYDILRKK